VSRRRIITSSAAVLEFPDSAAISIGSVRTKMLEASIADCAAEPLVNWSLSNSSCFLSEASNCVRRQTRRLYNLTCMLTQLFYVERSLIRLSTSKT